MNRPNIKKSSINNAIETLKDKIQHSLDEKGDGSFSSTHEILGIIQEEHHELIDAVRSNSQEDVAKELLDIAVGAILGMACIKQKSIDW